MKGASILFTVFLFVLALQLGAVLKRSGALPAEHRRDMPKAVLVPVAAAPMHPQAPEATVNL